MNLSIHTRRAKIVKSYFYSIIYEVIVNYLIIFECKVILVNCLSESCFYFYLCVIVGTTKTLNLEILDKNCCEIRGKTRKQYEGDD